jgi:hypothetical protein
VSFTLACALQLSKKHGKTLSQGKKNLCSGWRSRCWF